MKGIVFRELLSLVESQFGEDTLDQGLLESKLPPSAVYASAGPYTYEEILSLVRSLSRLTGVSKEALIQVFGEHLIKVFATGFPRFFEDQDVFKFLLSINDVIIPRVLRLYVEAELPHFTFEQPDSETLVVHYTSVRPLADLAEGLIKGTIKYFNESVEVSSLDTSDGKGTRRTFFLKRLGQ